MIYILHFLTGCAFCCKILAAPNFHSENWQLETTQITFSVYFGISNTNKLTQQSDNVQNHSLTHHAFVPVPFRGGFVLIAHTYTSYSCLCDEASSWLHDIRLVRDNKIINIFKNIMTNQEQTKHLSGFSVHTFICHETCT